MATTKYINRFLRGNSGCEFRIGLYLHPIVDADIDRQQWMLLSGTVIVVIGQSLWNMGFRNSSISTASLIGSFAPIVGILADTNPNPLRIIALMITPVLTFSLGSIPSRWLIISTMPISSTNPATMPRWSRFSTLIPKLIITSDLLAWVSLYFNYKIVSSTSGMWV